METERPVSYVPEEVIPALTPARFVLGWTSVIVLVLLCNFLVAPRMLEGGRNLAGWIIGHKWKLLLGLSQPVDDLILGDSSCNQGVNPVLLAEGLGDERAVNLCTIGDMLALNDAWMLETYIRRFGPPRRVLIVHVYDIWSRDFDWSRVGSIPIGITRLKGLRPPVRLQRWQWRSYLESRYFPLYSSNLSLQTVLRPGDPRAQQAPRRRQVDSLGFLADTTAFPDSVEQDLRSHLKFLGEQQFRLSGDNRRSLEHIARLAEEHEFDVYLAPAPIYERLARAESFQSYNGQIREAIERVTAATARVHLLDLSLTFPATELQNADHLVLAAANRFTLALAAEIRKIEATLPLVPRAASVRR